MKPTSTSRHGKRRKASRLVPSFEECLLFLMDNLSHERDGLRRSTLTPKQKFLFKQMESKADELSLEDYNDILRQLLVPGLSGMTDESKAHVEALQAERTQFLKRYEALHWQVLPGKAKREEVLWILAHRFLIPWLALRLAFRLPDDANVGTTPADCWFIPLHGTGLGSCVSKVIDRCRKTESTAAFARRCHDHFPADKQKTHAKELEGDLSKYANLKTTPSDATINLIVEAAHDVPHLRLILVLARFIDRCVRDARAVFEDELVLELIGFFVLCFGHFRGVLKQVRAEAAAGPHDKVQQFGFTSAGQGVPMIPATEADRVWLRLNSPTDMGNTPGQWKRFLPLMDEHMNELPRRINAELRRTVRSGELSFLPRDYDELNAGRWPFQTPTAIPEEIENAPIRNTVQVAVDVSRKEFQGKPNLKQAWAARQRFEFMAMNACSARAHGHQGMCSKEDAVLADAECKRLFALVLQHAPKRQRFGLGVEFLKYLIQPFRTKSEADRTLARGLLKQVAAPLRRSKLSGALSYFEGCLLALEGKHRAALKSLATARKLGRESCGREWIDMLRAGLMAADCVGSKREQKNFGKQVQLFGVFSTDSTPRTNAMQTQMIEAQYRQAWKDAFQSFPPKSRRRKGKRPSTPKGAKPSSSK